MPCLGKVSFVDGDDSTEPLKPEREGEGPMGCGAN